MPLSSHPAEHHRPDGAGTPKRTVPAVPRVAVAIPTFNRSALLKVTIESVVAQSFANFRLIVSDNASDDDTPDAVRSFGDERIDYVRAEHNIGAPGNFRRVLELAEA